MFTYLCFIEYTCAQHFLWKQMADRNNSEVSSRPVILEIKVTGEAETDPQQSHQIVIYHECYCLHVAGMLKWIHRL